MQILGPGRFHLCSLGFRNPDGAWPASIFAFYVVTLLGCCPFRRSLVCEKSIHWAASNPLGYRVGITWPNLQTVDISSSPRCSILAGSGQFTSKCISESRVSWCALMCQWLQNWHSSACGCLAVQRSGSWGWNASTTSTLLSLWQFEKLFLEFFLVYHFEHVYMILYIYAHIHIRKYIFRCSWVGSTVPGCLGFWQGSSVLEQSLQHLDVWSSMGPMLAQLVGPKWHLRLFMWELVSNMSHFWVKAFWGYLCTWPLMSVSSDWLRCPLLRNSLSPMAIVYFGI